MKRPLAPTLALPLMTVLTTAAVPRSPFSEQEVTFRSDSVTLAGTLVLPEGGGRHPGIVFLHGSGPSTRAGARPYAEAFARLGFASLIFDKRGSGESGGSWTTASLQDLADDALAAVSLLKARSDVDSTRIGLWGVSQAGWVMTLAAARAGDIGFLIAISGGGATPREEEMYSYRERFAAAGLAPDAREDAERVIGLYFDWLGSGRGRDRVVAAIDSARSRPWYSLAPLDRILPSEANRPNWSWVANWDPAPSIRKLHMPILLMFGSADREQPTDVAVRKWKEGLRQAGNDSATVMIFPGAGHGIRMGAHREGPRRAPFADGYLEEQIGWLWLHVLGGARD